MNFAVLPGRAPVVVVRPRRASLGHQVLEFLMGIHLARALGGAVVFALDEAPVNSAVFALDCLDAEILRGAAARSALAAERRARRWRSWREWPAARRAAVDRTVLDWLGGLAARYPPARAWRKQFKGHMGRFAAAAGRSAPDFRGLDFRACYAGEPLRFRLPADLQERADDTAAGFGISPAAPLATLHVRESGFKQGHEAAVDALRNARIDDYRALCDRLVEQGYTIARVGDAAMSPFAHPGVVDVATSPARSDHLELALLMRSAIFVACDSGPYVTSYLTGVPCLAANVTNVLGGYPLHGSDRYLLKHPVERATGRRLSVCEMLSADYFVHRKDLDRYAFEDNTSAELVQGVDELLDLVSGRASGTTREQDVVHQLASALYDSPLVAAGRTRKGEPAHQLLGHGRLGAAFAARFLDRG